MTLYGTVAVICTAFVNIICIQPNESVCVFHVIPTLNNACFEHRLAFETETQFVFCEVGTEL
jgi:hypothetical protein